MREKKIRVSAGELERLKAYRDEHFPGVPLGHVIDQFVRHADTGSYPHEVGNE